MGQILGFFIVQKEIETYYKGIKEIDQLWIEASKIIIREIDVNIFSIVINLRIVRGYLKIWKELKILLH